MVEDVEVEEEEWTLVEFEEEGYRDFRKRVNASRVGLLEDLVREVPKQPAIPPGILVDLWLEDQSALLGGRAATPEKKRRWYKAVRRGGKAPADEHIVKLNLDARIQARLDGSARRKISFAEGTRLGRAPIGRTRYKRNTVPKVPVEDDESSGCWREFVSFPNVASSSSQLWLTSCPRSQ